MTPAPWCSPRCARSTTGTGPRNVGTDGGFTLTWTGPAGGHRRRALPRGTRRTRSSPPWATGSCWCGCATGDGSRRAAGLQAMANVGDETAMRGHLSAGDRRACSAGAADGLSASGRVTRRSPVPGDRVGLLGLADLVTRARTPGRTGLPGRPGVGARAWRCRPGSPSSSSSSPAAACCSAWAARTALAGGRPLLPRHASRRCAAWCSPTWPITRTASLPDVAERVQIPRSTVDRTLQELQLLGLLEVQHIEYGARTRWLYSVAPDTDKGALDKVRDRPRPRPLAMFTRNVSRRAVCAHLNRKE